MKAYQVVENGKPLEQREIQTPEPQGKEVLLKTVACGVCHSDVHIHDGYFDLGGGVQLPSPLPGLASTVEVDFLKKKTKFFKKKWGQ